MQNQGMLKTLFTLKGNQRACLWTEPLWGIPFVLYEPFAALYMAALGLSLEQIGFVTSFSLIIQIFASVLSGVLTDKLGRRKCTMLTDLFAWTTPMLIWTFADGFNWFLVAALFNGLQRVSITSWNLLMVEECEPDLIVKCFSLTQFAGLLAVFFAPLSMLGVERFGLVPAMRVIYGIGFVLMTTKAFLLYACSKETQIGLTRMEETRGRSISQLLLECVDVITGLLKDKRVLLALGTLAAFQAIKDVKRIFWGLYLVNNLGVKEEYLALFLMLRSIGTLVGIMIIVPRLRYAKFKRPMLVSWGMFLAAEAVLLTGTTGVGGLVVATVSALLEAFALSVLVPMTDSLLVINTEERERARILGLVYAFMLLPASIFPALAGWLASFTLAAPLVLTMALVVVGAALTVWLSRQRGEESVAG